MGLGVKSAILIIRSGTVRYGLWIHFFYFLWSCTSKIYFNRTLAGIFFLSWGRGGGLRGCWSIFKVLIGGGRGLKTNLFKVTFCVYMHMLSFLIISKAV